MTEGEDYHNGFENSVYLDVHTKLCDLYGVFKKKSLYIGSNVSSLSSSAKASSIA